MPLKVGFIISFVLLSLDLVGVIALTWLQILAPLAIGLGISLVATGVMLYVLWRLT